MHLIFFAEKKHPRIIYSGHCFIGAGDLRREEQNTKTRGIRPGVTASIGVGEFPKTDNRAECVNVCCAGREGHGHRQLHKHMYQDGQAHEEENGNAHPHEYTHEHVPE